MLSYRHAFHAGNHADVLKHSVLSLLLTHLTQKEKAFTYIDTHAACGVYDLHDDRLLKTKEALSGIEKLLSYESSGKDVCPDSLEPYMLICRSLYDEKFLYAGSPEIARRLSRPHDTLVFCELHTNEVLLLKNHMKADRRVHVHHRSGYEALPSLLHDERICVLIDPSYEVDSDYTDTVSAIQKAFKRRANALFALWYPIVARRTEETAFLTNSVCALCADSDKVLHIRLYPEGVVADGDLGVASSGYGLSASGMLILNAPWTLKDHARKALSWICSALGEKACFTIE